MSGGTPEAAEWAAEEGWTYPNDAPNDNCITKGTHPYGLQVTGNSILRRGEMQMVGPNDRSNVTQVGQLTKRVISRPVKIAPAPATWFAEIGSESHTAATTMATTGVR